MLSTIRVAVVGARGLFAQIPSSAPYKRKIVEADSEPDVVMLDTRGHGDLMELANIRQNYDVPALFVVRNREELDILYPRLLPGDDVCLLRDFRQTAAFRLVRLFGDGSGRTPMHFYKKMLITDALTGLPNRRILDETLDQWSVGLSPSNPLSAIIVDLDHFRAVNDEFGHVTGDRILVETANLLKPHISDEIFACRYGGEEMLVLMKANNSRAFEFAEFLRKEFESNLQITDNRPVTASFGVATARDGDEVRENLIRRADELLYQAKSEGRNRVIGQETEGDDDAGLMDEDAVLRDFEVRLKVTTDRLVDYLTQRGRKLADYYRKEAELDGMTGLHRKEYFERRFDRDFEMALSSKQPLTLLFLDIDDFGNVNRTYGYPTGDATLKKVSRVMLDSVRTVDWAARYGGEELCIIMPGTTVEEARLVAERVRTKVEDLEIIAYDGRRFGVTASVGLAEISREDKAPVDLIQRAGDKTREAKKAGKNTVRF